MEYIPEESKPGKYYVYHNEAGEKYVVLEGLYSEDVHSPGVIETWTRQHYEQLEAAYWVLFFATFAYLIYTFILTPLYQQRT